MPRLGAFTGRNRKRGGHTRLFRRVFVAQFVQFHAVSDAAGVQTQYLLIFANGARPFALRGIQLTKQRMGGGAIRRDLQRPFARPNRARKIVLSFAARKRFPAVPSICSSLGSACVYASSLICALSVLCPHWRQNLLSAGFFTPHSVQNIRSSPYKKRRKFGCSGVQVLSVSTDSLNNQLSG